MSSPEPSTAPKVMPFAYPLDDFYSRAGQPLPRIEVIRGEEVPEPYRSLLVHDCDMTPTLEAFHKSVVHLDVLSREVRGEAYLREVVLRLDTSGQPVEFGAIKIALNLFGADARRRILEERDPLGHILRDCKVQHSSRPKAFIRVISDSFINRALSLAGEQLLFGRRNTLHDPQQRPLAEIVEILPPTTTL